MGTSSVHGNDHRLSHAPGHMVHCGGDAGVLSKRLVDCNLSVRTLNGLHANGVDTVGDLVKLHKTDLLRMRNCGKKMLSELDDFLSDLGLCFKSV